MAQKNGERERTERRFSGKASDGADRILTVQQARLSGAVSGPQMRAMRKDGWTPERRRLFMETLAITCNVSEAARTVGMNLSSAYYQKRRDPGFAAEWHKALSVGYDELEALLLRQSLFGTEEEEIILDAEGAVKSRKIKRGHPTAIGVRLLSAHAQEVQNRRAQEAEGRPDGEDAVERLRIALAQVRGRGEEDAVGE